MNFSIFSSSYLSKFFIIREASHSRKKAYEIFSGQKDAKGFLMDFSRKRKDFAKDIRDILTAKYPSYSFL